MRSALMVYAGDLLDEGFDEVVAVAMDRGGMDALELAAVYHHGRDVYPHNPRHKVWFLDGGACFFRPDRRAFAGQRIQPHLATVLDEIDPLRRLLEVGQARGTSVRAWTINLHNFTLGKAYPDCTTRNAFGNPLMTDLCPTNPDSRAYVRTISAELARTGVGAIVAESVCFMPFEHGFHHERNPYRLSETTRFFMSACFCEHCRRAVERFDASPDRLQSFVREELERALSGAGNAFDETPAERSAVAALVGGEMAAFLDARERTVTTLVGEVAEAVAAVGSTRFVFMDSMGADDAGDQVGPLVADRSWRFGVDVAAVCRNSHGLSVMGYSRDRDRFIADVEAYQKVVPTDTPMSLVLRAMPPDCFERSDLEPKVRWARDAGIEWLEFYVYGLMRLDGLDWTRAAMAS